MLPSFHLFWRGKLNLNSFVKWLLQATPLKYVFCNFSDLFSGAAFSPLLGMTFHLDHIIHLSLPTSWPSSHLKKKKNSPYFPIVFICRLLYIYFFRFLLFSLRSFLDVSTHSPAMDCPLVKTLLKSNWMKSTKGRAILMLLFLPHMENGQN